MRLCAKCFGSLAGFRSDAHYCGSACRAAAWRERKAAEKSEREAAQRRKRVPRADVSGTTVNAPQSRSEPFSDRLATDEEEREIERVREKLARWERST